MRTCISHESALIRQIVSYGIHFARSESPVGHNVLFCAGRYHSTINSILYGSFNDIVSWRRMELHASHKASASQSLTRDLHVGLLCFSQTLADDRTGGIPSEESVWI